MKGLLPPSQNGSGVSCLPFLSAMSAEFITSCPRLSVLSKLSPRRRQTCPPGRSLRIAVLLLHASIPPGREPSLSLLCGQIEKPQSLAAGQCQAQLPEPDRGSLLSELNASFRRALIASCFLFEFNPHGYQFCSVDPSSKTDNSRAVGP